MKWILLTGLLILLGGKDGMAQDDKIHSNWPDQTEDVQTVKKGTFQFETGLSYTRFKHDKDALIGYKSIRYGLVKNLELGAIAQDGLRRDLYIENTSQGNYPLAVNLRYAILKGHSALPDITLVGYIKLPFTSRTAQQKAYWSPSLTAVFQNKISKKLKLQYSGGIRQGAYSKDIAWAATGELQYDVTKKIGLYAEYFAQYKSDDQPQHNADAGILYYVSSNAQFNLAAGSTIAYDEPNQFISLGFSFRIPRKSGK